MQIVLFVLLLARYASAKKMLGWALYLYLRFCIIPTLFAFFLACHPYCNVFLHFNCLYFLVSVLVLS